MFDPLKEYFNFSKKERKGIYQLLFLMVVVLAVKLVMPLYYSSTSITSNTELLMNKHAKLLAIRDSVKKRTKTKNKIKIDSLFNPNDFDVEKWGTIGFSEKQSKNIVNYIDLVKGIKYKEQLSKIYAIDDSIYTILEPFINLPNQDNYYTSKYNSVNKKNDNVELDENKTLVKFLADSSIKSNWTQFGLTNKQASIIVNYINKYKPITSYNQLKRIYVLDSNLVEYNRDYIILSSESEMEQPVKIKLNIIVNINSATEQELQKLKGVGKYYSKKIVEYRESLGGFYSKTQLLEIYRIDSLLLQKNDGNIRVDTTQIIKLNLNSIEFKELLKHPYFDYTLTKAIFDERDRRRKFKSVNAIKKINFVSPKLFKQLKPYITVRE